MTWGNIISVMPHVDYHMDLIYPPSEQELTRNVIYVRTTVSSDEGFAERTRIKIHAGGSLADGFAENVSQVQVFFKGAYFELFLQPHVVGPQPPSLVGQPSAGVYLTVRACPRYGIEGMALVSSDAVCLVSYEDTLVQWMTQGDYYPTLIIVFKNDSNITQDYPQFRLHIEPFSTLESEKTGLKFYWTGGVAVFVVTLMEEGLRILEKREKSRLLDRFADTDD
jgi:hypothetical protein